MKIPKLKQKIPESPKEAWGASSSSAKAGKSLVHSTAGLRELLPKRQRRRPAKILRMIEKDIEAQEERLKLLEQAIVQPFQSAQWVMVPVLATADMPAAVAPVAEESAPAPQIESSSAVTSAPARPRHQMAQPQPVRRPQAARHSAPVKTPAIAAIQPVPVQAPAAQARPEAPAQPQSSSPQPPANGRRPVSASYQSISRSAHPSPVRHVAVVEESSEESSVPVRDVEPELNTPMASPAQKIPVPAPIAPELAAAMVPAPKVKAPTRASLKFPVQRQVRRHLV